MFVATVLAGCQRNPGPERVVVSGSITYNGKAIPEGVIRFVPDQSSSMPTMATAIKEGKYNADGLGGVPIGTHKVQIEAMRAIEGRSQSNANTLHGTGYQQYIPKKYNAMTQLTVTVPSGSGRMTKAFELKD
jgi:hypothetical protein